MSGIIGVYYLDGRPVASELINGMVQSMTHRGPDGLSSMTSGVIGLGHCLLHSTPESLHERQPLTSSDKRVMLSADARLDNRLELIRALELRDRNPAELTDPDLILAAWEKWHEQCTQHLLGDFAFALWDERRHAFFCARDHAGVRPFYYFHLPGKLFVCATEIKALFCLPEIPRQLNEAKVADLLIGFYDDKAITFYKDIQRLPPAHQILLNEKGMTLQSYWALNTRRRVRLNSDDEYAEAFREIFVEAVNCRMRCHAPVITQLSGGLDSSSITCVGRQFAIERGLPPLHTLSAVFPSLAEQNPTIDERNYVQAVVAQGHINPIFVQADRLNPMVNVLQELDEHLNIPNIFMECALYGAAKDQGMRVLLSGHDGDCVVSYGMEYLESLFRSGRWLKLYREAQALARAMGGNTRKLIKRFVIRPSIPGFIMHYWRLLKGNYEDVMLPYGVINRDFARRIGHIDRLEKIYKKMGGSWWDLRQGHVYGLTSGLDLYGLEFFNHLGAMHNIEPRFPFYDRRLMEFCLAIPFDQKLKGGRSRLVFRRAMKGILPPQIEHRQDKGNLSVNFNTRLLEFGKETIERVLFKEPGVIAEYVDLDGLRQAYHDLLQDPVRQHEAATRIFMAVTLSLWLDSKGFSEGVCS